MPDDLLLKIPFSALVTNDHGESFRVLADRYKTHSAPTSEDFEILYPQMSWLAERNLAISSYFAACVAERSEHNIE